MKNPLFTIGIIAVVSSLLSIGSCSTAKIYSTPDAVTLAKEHKIVAVIPCIVSIAPQKNIDPESIKDQEKNESLVMQKEMFAWLLERKSKAKELGERKSKGKFQADLIDIETLNAKLKKIGYPENGMAPAELCAAINVDGLISSTFSFPKPFSEGAAIAMSFLGIGGTNEAHGAISIYDAKSKKMLWQMKTKM